MIEITHITKPDRFDIHSRIREVGAMAGGTVLWRLTLDQAIAKAYQGEQFFVRRGGTQVFVEVMPGSLLGGGPYMRTVPDYTGANNLLSLPELPPHASANLLASLLNVGRQ